MLSEKNKKTIIYGVPERLLKSSFKFLPGLGWIISIGIIIPLIGSLVANHFFQNIHWVHIPIHSVVESLGSIAALLMAILLLLLRGNSIDNNSENFWICCGLISMGLLDGLHAATAPGNIFVWLHGLATFFGGALFAMSWIRYNGPKPAKANYWLWILAVSTFAIGLLSLIFHPYLPNMYDEKGFTIPARILNTGGGLFFYLAAIHLILRFKKDSNPDPVLFATLALLFGSAGILFELSQLWDLAWWWGHLLRLVAYSFAFLFVINYYIQLNYFNRTLIKELSETNKTLEQKTHLLSKNEQRFNLAVEATGDGIWDWDIDQNKMYFSPRWKAMLGYQPSELRSNFSEWQNLIHRDDLGSLLEAWGNALDGTHTGYTLEYRMKTKSGKYIWVCSRAVVVRNKDNKIYRMAGSHTDITARKAAEEDLLEHQRVLEDTIKQRTKELQQANIQLEKLASIDSLTGISNRRLFDIGIDREWKRCSRENKPFSLMMLDIDFFKNFNDSFGHQKGDDVLKRIASVLDNTVKRSTDIVSRYGGEEFAIILPDTDFSQLMELANQIHNNISALKIPAADCSRFANVTVSIGVGTHIPDKTDSWEIHLANVDKALYQAKKYGRNQTAVAAKNQ
ncbi:MAG: diguanylate cyclase [Gammaproteobacteria bacterium]